MRLDALQKRSATMEVSKFFTHRFYSNDVNDDEDESDCGNDNDNNDNGDDDFVVDISDNNHEDVEPMLC